MTDQPLHTELIPLEHLADRLDSGNWYFVIDACDEPQVPQLVKQLGSDLAVSLYRGWTETYYWALAPYLFRANSTLFQWVQENLPGKPWGIALKCSADLPTVRKHLRRFLQVKLPDHRKVLFRFYDPRPLPAFLNSSSTEQLSAFFGPIESLLCPGEKEWTLYQHQPAAVAPPRVMEITPEQLQKLDEHMDASFLVRMVKHLESAFPDETAPIKSELPKRTAKVIHEAKQYGIEYEHEIQQYLELAMTFPSQMKNPKPSQVEEILTYPNRPAERKLRFLQIELDQSGAES